jgi:hypothetical protein
MEKKKKCTIIVLCQSTITNLQVKKHMIEKFNVETVTRVWRTDNTMAKRKRTKGEITIYKTLHRKLKTEQREPH